MYFKDNKVKINLRLSEDEISFCKEQALLLGWSVSRYIRYLVDANMAEFENGVNNKEFYYGNQQTDFDDFI